MEKNKKLILAAALLLAILLTSVSNEASAFIAPEGVMLSNFVGPIAQYLFDIIKQLLTGLIYFLISSLLFNFSVNNSPKMLDLKNSDFVQTGLGITTSLADILLIAVFIAIALGTIFNAESINAKKHFLKFAVAALLIHFAPLFVYMAIDVGNIIMSGLIVGSGQAAFSSIMNNFAMQILVNLVGIAGSYGAMAVVAGVPFANIFAGVVLASVGLLGTFAFLPGVLIQIMVMGILTGLLFSFAIFFLTRIFIIQILAVLAPLAILASVLPKTESYFKTWLSWLIGWTVGGVLMLFLLTLGLTTAGGFLPDSIDFSSEGFNIGGALFGLLTMDHIKWIALAVYMITVQTLCAGAIPEISGKVSGKISEGMGAAAGKLGQGFRTGKYDDPKLNKKVDANFQSEIKSRIKRYAEPRFGARPSGASASSASSSPAAAPSTSKSYPVSSSSPPPIGSNLSSYDEGFGPPKMPDI
ncbi:MAG: hypothetical protein PHE11_07145 [Candidatus Omnitrophica bacterium]|nr:hypothetical protein [Candidatus Omnitrophota bacterium]MDD5527159.1 hypothetical protein [Candidatus Omnitrophota bacterium]